MVLVLGLETPQHGWHSQENLQQENFCGFFFNIAASLFVIGLYYMFPEKTSIINIAKTKNISLIP